MMQTLEKLAIQMIFATPENSQQRGLVAYIMGVNDPDDQNIIPTGLQVTSDGFLMGSVMDLAKGEITHMGAMWGSVKTLMSAMGLAMDAIDGLTVEEMNLMVREIHARVNWEYGPRFKPGLVQ